MCVHIRMYACMYASVHVCVCVCIKIDLRTVSPTFTKLGVNIILFEHMPTFSP